MPAPSRDRLPRPVDISTLYRGAARRVHLMVDEPGLRWVGLSGNGERVGGQRVIGNRRNFQRFPAAGRENRPPVTTTRRAGRRSVLPHWYPRTPLRDITGIVRAIDRRRAELQADQATEEAEVEAGENITNEPSISGAFLEHNEMGTSTPLPTILMKPRPSPVTTQAMKIMDHITLKDIREDPDFLTPQKKLLDSIEKVREVWLEEQRKLERTPAAKKAERERKLRVLMSMR